MIITNKKRVVVAMSGGVDSSVAAALLAKNGFDAVGVTMRLADEGRTKNGAGCCSIDAAGDARRVADTIGIPHYVIDFRERFKKYVIDYFLAEYAAGRTPNPCIACNRHIKFAALFEKAREIGAEYVATGHYARVTEDDSGFHLLKGIDEKKDQSYVLYHLTQDTLRRFLLPLGSFTKSETRALAEKFSLPVAQKPESQEICFVPDDDYVAYIREKNPGCLSPGNIVDVNGKILGTHRGVPLYTIGQRHGLGIAAPEPLYVLRLDAAKNEVVVGGASEVFSRSFLASDVTRTAPGAFGEKFRAFVKTRYGKRGGMATISKLGDYLRVEFDEAARAVTPGQSAVFYDGDEALGGGIIEEVLE